MTDSNPPAEPSRRVTIIPRPWPADEVRLPVDFDDEPPTRPDVPRPHVPTIPRAPRLPSVPAGCYLVDDPHTQIVETDERRLGAIAAWFARTVAGRARPATDDAPNVQY
jgi:hypothetical protein